MAFNPIISLSTDPLTGQIEFSICYVYMPQYLSHRTVSCEEYKGKTKRHYIYHVFFHEARKIKQRIISSCQFQKLLLFPK